MRKIILVILFLQFSIVLDAQCDSLKYENDLRNILEYGVKNVSEEISNDDILYQKNYINLMDKLYNLNQDYRDCQNRFYYYNSLYLLNYFRISYSNRCYLKRANNSYYLVVNRTKVPIDEDRWGEKYVFAKREKVVVTYFNDDREFKNNSFYSGSKHLNYLKKKIKLRTNVPNSNLQLLNSVDTQKYIQKKLKEKMENYFLTVVYIICFVLFLLLIVFLQLRKNEKQNKLITEQKSILEHQKQEITDSINYSKRIQTAILPDINEIKQSLNNFFILYQPKDIVSGDFYYFNKVNNDVFMAAADCTGHGVPGAFMSLVGSKELKIANAISNSPAQILKHLNNGVKDTLRQNHIDGTKDGMDIALVRMNGTTITYSAANRPLWILKKDSNAIEEIKATKTAIAGFTGDDFEFDEHIVNLEKGDCIYLFSDGYADQFGGDKQKKMTTKRFREFLLSIKNKSMNEQKLELENYFKNWQGNSEQVDDILVIGIRV